MDSLNFSCQGESHIATGKVCQDYSYSKIYENGNGIAIVCDGHGGKRYFRSDVGARIATEVAERKVTTFIEEAGLSLLKNELFTQYGTISEQITNNDFDKTSNVEIAFRQLFGSIIYEWNAEVLAHATQNPISEMEKEALEECWIKEFEENINLEKVYGCTLIVYAYTPKFWFAFQIGDGKCFACDSSGNWSEPIPWDERCFLNKTTSICDSDAIDEFRYCYEGDGQFPIAVILGSDGIDDSLGSEENQANFYVQILKSIVKSGLDTTLSEIETTLPQLSKIGSQDDMSIAMVFDSDKVKLTVPKMIEWQVANMKRAIAKESVKIEKANKIQQSLESIDHPTRQNMIDLQYANADEKRAIEARTKLQGRLDTLLKEFNENDSKKENLDMDNNIDSEDKSIVTISVNEGLNNGT
ncbi:MAG: protein phosphatase 2C domain-containing protein [Muribaculaceae bacterium]|nr:protein phosphatase 2C domain-containing protein [Muribaculaceae bacterium]